MNSRDRAGRAFGGLMLIFVAVSCSRPAQAPPRAPLPPAQPAVGAAGPTAAGPAAQSPPQLEATTTPDFAVQIAVVSELTSFGQYVITSAVPEDEFVVIEYKLTNRSSEATDPAAFPLPRLVDGDGLIYSADLGKSRDFESDYTTLANPPEVLNPGQTFETALIYEVPRGRFDHRTWVARFGSRAVELPAPVNGGGYVTPLSR